MRPFYDLETCYNNGTMAVRPGVSGQLKSLVKTLPDGQPKVWVFGNTQTWTDEAGIERFDHHRRGVVVGTLSEWEAFSEMCQQFGLRIGSLSFFVPFSNGQNTTGFDRQNKPLLADYTSEELALARIDLPTCDKLKALIAEQK